MKKIIAIVLSVICLFSMFAFVSTAADDDKDSPINLYGILYDNNALDVKIFYQANPSINLDGPGYVKVTKDTPIAVNHNFVCWKDEAGNLYYEGDEIYVDSLITLTAVWEPKTDNLPEIWRIVKCSLLSFERLFQNLFDMFDGLKNRG